MNLAHNYQYIYLAIVSVLSFSLFSRYRAEERSVPNNAASILLLVFMILFIGLRPVSGKVFVDMGGYAYHYRQLLGQPFEFDPTAENYLFDNLAPFMASMSMPLWSFFTVIAAMYFGFMCWACKRFFGDDVYAAFLVCLAAFSTFSYGTNGIKAGMAASFFLLAMSYMDRWWLCIPMALLSKGLHHSMSLPIVAFFCALLYSKPKYYFYVWVLSIFMALAHVGVFAQFFASLTDDRGAGYLIGETTTHVGFRLDFILYSAMPVWLGWRYLKRNPDCSLTYRRLLCTYLLANSVWMLCMYANFNNRIAYLSWFMYPIVLIYPILKDEWDETERYPFFAKVGSYHLCFTLFMVVVYYGLLHLGH